MAFGPHASYGENGRLYAQLLSLAPQMIMIKCKADGVTDLGSLDPSCAQLSNEGSRWEPPVPAGLMRRANTFFIQAIVRLQTLVYLVGANYWPLNFPKQFYHAKLTRPVVNLEINAITQLEGVVDPHPAQLRFSGANRDWGKIQRFVLHHVRTATVEEHTTGQVSFWHATMSTAWRSLRTVLKLILLDAKVVSTWAEYYDCKIRKLCATPIFVHQFLVLWPYIFIHAVTVDAYRAKIPNLLRGDAGKWLQNAVRRLKLTNYPIDLDTDRRRNILIADPAWSYSGDSHMLTRAPIQTPSTAGERSVL